MQKKKSKEFISELCFLIIFNVIFGALFWALDPEDCYTLIGRFYVITGIIYSIWLCILIVTQEGCEKFKISLSYFIELANTIMTVIFFVNLISEVNKDHFCSESSLKILTYVFLSIVAVILILIFLTIAKKIFEDRSAPYNPVGQQA